MISNTVSAKNFIIYFFPSPYFKLFFWQFFLKKKRMLLCSCFPYFPFKCREIQRTTWLEICVVCSVVRGCNLRFRFSRGLLWRDFASTRNPVILSKMLDVPCISEPMAFDSRCVMCLRATKFTPCFYAVSNVLM